MKKNSNLKLQKSKAHGYRFTVGRFLQMAVALVFLVFTARFLYIGISKTVNGQNLSQRTKQLYKRNQVIKATRGTIYDRNGLTIAEDSHLYTVYAILDKTSINYKNKPEYVVNKTKTAEKLAQVLPLSAEKIYQYLTPKKKVFQVQFGTGGSGLTLRQKKKIEAMKLPGIKFLETPSRLYPNGVFASHTVGLAQPIWNKKTNAQNLVGTMGIEAYFNKTLTGTDGYRISSVDASEYQLPNSNQVYKPAKNGNNLYLTLDSQLQSLLETRLSEVQKTYRPTSITATVEDMKTGKILAASQRPTFNPQTMKGLTKSYRDILVQDTYEPGSTFKTITAAIALEENLAKTDTPGDFNCIGYEEIANTKIRCTAVAGHGKETLRQALENSCNPALMQLGRRIGAEKFYKYLKAFGMFESTGIDLPSEGNSTFWPENKVGPIELATMSFGQRFKITPIQMVRAASALANNGELVTPRLVKQIENTNTGTITETKIDNVRKVVSKETSDKIRDMMHSVVENGGGRNAQVKGYEIGGKTGTSEADPNHPEEGYVSSFLAIAPVENTKLTVLLTLYKPQVKNHYGGHIAAPAVAQMLSEILPYLNIPSNISTDNVQSANITVPNVTNKKISDVKKQLKELKLQPDTKAPDDEIVKEQVPPSGTKLMENGIVKLYTNEYNTRVSKEVPNLKGKTLQQAKSELESRNLNISAEGTGIIISQEITSGKQVDEGTVIRVKLQEKISNSQH